MLNSFIGIDSHLKQLCPLWMIHQPFSNIFWENLKYIYIHSVQLKIRNIRSVHHMMHKSSPLNKRFWFDVHDITCIEHQYVSCHDRLERTLMHMVCIIHRYACTHVVCIMGRYVSTHDRLESTRWLIGKEQSNEEISYITHLSNIEISYIANLSNEELGVAARENLSKKKKLSFAMHL